MWSVGRSLLLRPHSPHTYSTGRCWACPDNRDASSFIAAPTLYAPADETLHAPADETLLCHRATPLPTNPCAPPSNLVRDRSAQSQNHPAPPRSARACVRTVCCVNQHGDPSRPTPPLQTSPRAARQGESTGPHQISYEKSNHRERRRGVSVWVAPPFPSIPFRPIIPLSLSIQGGRPLLSVPYQCGGGPFAMTCTTATAWGAQGSAVRRGAQGLRVWVLVTQERPRRRGCAGECAGVRVWVLVTQERVAVGVGWDVAVDIGREV